MAQVPIEILDLRKHRTNLLADCVILANKIQDGYSFSLLEQSKAADLSFALRDDTGMEDFLPKLEARKLEWRGYHPFLLCLFDTAINHSRVHNLFSVDYAAGGVAVVTLHNVEKAIIATERIASYIIFQFAFFALKFSGGNLPFHNEDRNCIFDYREKKAAIVDTIRNGHICDECKEKLERVGGRVSPNQRESIFRLFNEASLILQSTKIVKSRGRPRGFIGSSVEGLGIARSIKAELEHDFYTDIWNQSDVSGLGTSTLEALEAAVGKYHFGIFVFTPDDQIKMRDKESFAPRDNVIFEFGLFIGKLGRFKSFLVRPRGIEIQIPSDINGITVADYDHENSNKVAAVGTACTKLRTAINADIF